MDQEGAMRRRFLRAGAVITSAATAGCLRLVDQTNEQPTTGGGTQTQATEQASMPEFSLVRQWEPPVGADIVKSTEESFILAAATDDEQRIDRYSVDGTSNWTAIIGGLHATEPDQMVVTDSKVYLGDYKEAERENQLSTGQIWCYPKSVPDSDSRHTNDWSATTDGQVEFLDATDDLCVAGTNSPDVNWASENTGRVYAISGTDGSIQWRNENFESTYIKGVEITESGVVVGTSDQIVLLDAGSGEIIRELESAGVFDGGMTFSEGVLYKTGNVERAIEVSSGDQIWESSEVPETVGRTSPTVSRTHGKLIFGTRTGRIVVLALESGDLHWKGRMPSRITTSPKVWRDFVFIVDESGEMGIFNVNTSERRLKSGYETSPPFSFVQDTIFLGGLLDTAYSIEIE